MDEKTLKTLCKAMGNKPIVVNVLVDKSKTEVIGCKLRKYSELDEYEDEDEEGPLENPYKSYLG